VKNKQIAPIILSIASILCAWQLLAWWVNHPNIFPTVDKLVLETLRLFADVAIYKALFYTILRGLVGFAVAFVFAFATGSLAAFSSFWSAFFQPLVVVIRSVPIISIVLVALLWFSPTQLPVFIAFLTMFPVLHQAVSTAFKQVDRSLIEMSKVFGYSSTQTFLNIHLPISKKLIVDGVRTATGFGWRAIIIGEVLAQPLHGIGSGMKLAQVYLNVSELFAWTVVAVVVSYVFDAAILKFSQLRFSRFIPLHRPVFRNTTAGSQFIQLHSVHKSFDDKPVISDLSVKLEAGKVYLLKSASGKGKTTLLKLLSKIHQPDKGEINFQAVSTVAYSFQDLRLCPWLTVRQNIGFADSSKANSSFINQLMADFELADLQQKWPAQLSGGQLQRVALARALAAKADLLLLDEPLNGLDAALKERVVSVVNNYILTYKPIVVWATHEEFELKNLTVEELMN